MRRMRVIFFALVLWTLSANVVFANSLVWFECPMSGVVDNIDISGPEDKPQIALKIDVRIVMYRKGYGASQNCGIKRGSQITISNFVTEEEQNAEKKRSRTFQNNGNAIKNLKPGDKVALDYSFYDDSQGIREIWKFTRVKRR